MDETQDRINQLLTEAGDNQGTLNRLTREALAALATRISDLEAEVRRLAARIDGESSIPHQDN